MTVARAASRPTCGNCGVRHRNRTTEECIDRDMAEVTLQARIVGRGKTRGWKFAHAGRGIAAFTAEGEPIFVTPMSKGWPDLFGVNVRQRRVLAIECKKEDGEVSEEQQEWIDALNACGIPTVVARPSDLRTGRINAILARQSGG